MGFWRNSMAEYQIPYGNGQVKFEIADSKQVDWIEPKFTPPAPDAITEVIRALETPLGRNLPSKNRTHQSVIIAINDKTRPVPYFFLLPPLLRKLLDLGYVASDIRFIVATGTHTPLDESEIWKLLPQEICQNFQVISHNCDDDSNLVALGITQRGTPIQTNKMFYESDLRILIGNIEPHHFAGFSGGTKTSVIGLGGRTTINRNHSLLMDPKSTIGEFKKNPLRLDIEEIGKKIGRQFALNVVMNSERNIVEALFGDPSLVMKKGLSASEKICLTQVREKASIVIASVGGHPKDINLYQSQKALTHSSLICKDNGVVILVASCPEGSGSRAYEEFMTQTSSVQEALEQFKLREFKVGPHKAFQFARELVRIKVILVSNMDSNLVRKLHLIPAVNINDAIQKANDLVPGESRYAILPHATNTIPQLA
jgi:nickel-dependent lactate racemase